MFNQLATLSIQLEHHHSDGSWSSFERAHHDAADHDPERDWAKGEVYVCTACDEQVRVRVSDEAPTIRP